MWRWLGGNADRGGSGFDTTPGVGFTLGANVGRGDLVGAESYDYASTDAACGSDDIHGYDRWRRHRVIHAFA